MRSFVLNAPQKEEYPKQQSREQVSLQRFIIDGFDLNHVVRRF